MAGFCRQRFQWSLDALRLFFWDNPLFKRGLGLYQRGHFLIIMLAYLVSGLALPIFYLMPLMYYLKGYSFVNGAEFWYLVLRGAYLGATILMFRYLFFGKAALKQFKILCGLFAVNTAAILTALVSPPGRKPAYRLNNLHPFIRTSPLFYQVPHLILISLHLALPFLSLVLGWAPPRLIALNALFSTFIVWVLSEMVLTGWRTPKWSPDMDPRHIYVS